MRERRIHRPVVPVILARLVILAILAICVPALGQTNLLTNGSFNDPPILHALIHSA